jgi:drug/metabolite transporter (DMT)-like permease
VAILLATLSALCFGTALVTAKCGLRSLDARAGAAISIPTATLLFALASPFFLTTSGYVLHAALLFALVGLFFPALVTLLTFESNDRLGPTLTAAVSGTAPLFALAAAAVLLGEHLPARAVAAAMGVAAGVALLSWRTGARRAAFGWAFMLPVAGALLRGVAQAIAKAGLLLWPNPFAAGLIGYAVSSAAVVAADQFPRTQKSVYTKSAVAWFALTGVLNGGAVLLMYAALSMAPVSLVAPVVAAYPLVTMILGAAVLHEDAPGARMIAGAALTVASIVFLVAG